MIMIKTCLVITGPLKNIEIPVEKKPIMNFQGEIYTEYMRKKTSK